VPEGVAAALSFRSDYGTDVEFIRDPVTHKVTHRPRAMHRGRMFLGPFGTNAFGQDGTTHRTKFQAVFMSDACTALNKNLLVTDSGSNAWHFQQWSRRSGVARDITTIWMDDRPDYQRRRTDQSTARTTQTALYA
jgi:hypothetical protein